MDQNPQEASASPKQQVAERVRSATNVLVTVRSDPTVDELSAAIGLTLMLNKLGKHATAVFSGQVPSTLEFLKPEETIETNTDSLRDFIVSLDKSKADKLRYKVEENVVKIFITPYRTSITEKDLEFTQGDFNVDVVLALGVTQREELDQAITSHGRILHDATVVTITAGQRESTLGAINWQDAAASSLSEMLVSISEAFQGGLIDAQMATAFLTGIVSETERFSNTKTSPKVMTMAAQLMAAGANQQLIANELDKAVEVDIQNAPAPATESAPPEIAVSEDGSLSIPHDSADATAAPQAPSIDELLDEAAQKQSEATPPEDPGSEQFLDPLPPSEAGESFEPLLPSDNPAASTVDAGNDAAFVMPTTGGQPAEDVTEAEPDIDLSGILPPLPSPGDTQGPEGQIHIDDHGNLMRKAEAPKHKVIEPLNIQSRPISGMPETQHDSSSFVQQPAPEETQVDPLAAPDTSTDTLYEQKLDAVAPPALDPAPHARELPPMPEMAPDTAPDILPDDTTLTEIEQSVHSPHLAAQGGDPVQAAKDAVNNALNQADPDPDRLGAREDIGSSIGPAIDHTLPQENSVLPQPDASLTDVLGSQSSNDDAMSPPPVPPPFSPGSFPPGQ